MLTATDSGASTPTLTKRLTVLLLLTMAPATARSQEPGARYVNPPGLVEPAGYTHVVVAADGRSVYIAGQVAFDSTGRVVGVGDFHAQAEQVFANLGRALSSVGASFADVVKTTTFITDVQQVPTLREVRTRYLDPTHPPANTLIAVSSLARADLMVEIEAVAVLRGALRESSP
jgi:enamine deaminase RidA (YjgF/YER057c/UK114 family)